MLVKRSRSSRTPSKKRRKCAICGVVFYADRTYCTQKCRDEAGRRAKLARRPAQGSIRCAFCQQFIDVLAREPARFAKNTAMFCDEICANAYRQEQGVFEQMSQAGQKRIADYQQTHGERIAHQHRSAITSKGNQTAPPRAKHLKRSGSVWGWQVDFTPDGTGGYHAAIPDLQEIGVQEPPISCKTVKEGLRLWRKRFIELRLKERAPAE